MKYFTIIWLALTLAILTSCKPTKEAPNELLNQMNTNKSDEKKEREHQEDESVVQARSLTAILKDDESLAKRIAITHLTRISDQDLRELSGELQRSPDLYFKNVESFYLLLEKFPNSGLLTTLVELSENRNTPPLDASLFDLHKATLKEDCSDIVQKHTDLLIEVEKGSLNLHKILKTTKKTILNAIYKLKECPSKAELLKELNVVLHQNPELLESSNQQYIHLTNELRRSLYKEELSQNLLFNLYSKNRESQREAHSLNRHFYSARGSYEIAKGDVYPINENFDNSSVNTGRKTNGYETNSSVGYAYDAQINPLENNVGITGQVVMQNEIRGGHFKRKAHKDEDLTAKIDIEIKGEYYIPKCTDLTQCNSDLRITAISYTPQTSTQVVALFVNDQAIPLNGQLQIFDRLISDYRIKIVMKDKYTHVGACCVTPHQSDLYFTIFIPKGRHPKIQSRLPKERMEFHPFTWLPTLRIEDRYVRDISTWSPVKTNDPNFYINYFDSAFTYKARQTTSTNPHEIYASQLHMSRLAHHLEALYDDEFLQSKLQSLKNLEEVTHALGVVLGQMEEQILKNTYNEKILKGALSILKKSRDSTFDPIVSTIEDSKKFTEEIHNFTYSYFLDHLQKTDQLSVEIEFIKQVQLQTKEQGDK